MDVSDQLHGLAAFSPGGEAGVLIEYEAEKKKVL
jgi:hypothetical protein